MLFRLLRVGLCCALNLLSSVRSSKVLRTTLQYVSLPILSLVLSLCSESDYAVLWTMLSSVRSSKVLRTTFQYVSLPILSRAFPLFRVGLCCAVDYAVQCPQLKGPTHNISVCFSAYSFSRAFPRFSSDYAVLWTMLSNTRLSNIYLSFLRSFPLSMLFPSFVFDANCAVQNSLLQGCTYNISGLFLFYTLACMLNVCFPPLLSSIVLVVPACFMALQPPPPPPPPPHPPTPHPSPIQRVPCSHTRIYPRTPVFRIDWKRK